MLWRTRNDRERSTRRLNAQIQTEKNNNKHKRNPIAKGMRRKNDVTRGTNGTAQRTCGDAEHTNETEARGADDATLLRAGREKKPTCSSRRRRRRRPNGTRSVRPAQPRRRGPSVIPSAAGG